MNALLAPAVEEIDLQQDEEHAARQQQVQQVADADRVQAVANFYTVLEKSGIVRPGEVGITKAAFAQRVRRIQEIPAKIRKLEREFKKKKRKLLLEQHSAPKGDELEKVMSVVEDLYNLDNASFELITVTGRYKGVTDRRLTPDEWDTYQGTGELPSRFSGGERPAKRRRLNNSRRNSNPAPEEPVHYEEDEDFEPSDEDDEDDDDDEDGDASDASDGSTSSLNAKMSATKM